MKLYLIQHGEAKAEAEDPGRPLTPKGRSDVEALARKAAAIGIRAGSILHSPKLRSKQTAAILASSLHARAFEVEGLLPDDGPMTARDLVESEGKDLVLVGHMPHLSRLCSLLLSGADSADLIAFRTGCAVCLVKEEKWRIAWMLVPEIV